MKSPQNATNELEIKLLDTIVPLLETDEAEQINVALSAITSVAAMVASGEGIERDFFMKQVGRLFDEYRLIHESKARNDIH
jgi:hypothetical protein